MDDTQRKTELQDDLGFELLRRGLSAENANIISKHIVNKVKFFDDGKNFVYSQNGADARDVPSIAESFINAFPQLREVKHRSQTAYMKMVADGVEQREKRPTENTKFRDPYRQMIQGS